MLIYKYKYDKIRWIGGYEMGVYLDNLTPEQLEVVNSIQLMPDDKIKPDYRREDLTDQVFGEWSVIKYSGKKHWICMCSCGTIKNILTKELKSGNTKSCGHNKQTESLVGKRFGYLEVIEKVDGKHHKCICHCGCGGTEKVVGTYDLKVGKVKSCGINTTRKESILGKKFNNWEVIEYIGDGKYRCKCHCGCGGNESIVRRADLVSGQSKSCGFHTNAIKDITGQRFGKWTAIRHVGYGRWLCRCSCENQTEKIIRHTELLNGESKSCGCKRSEIYRNTMLDRYGEVSSARLNNPRTNEQIAVLASAENLLNFINETFDHKPTVYEMHQVIGMSYSHIIKAIHNYKLEDKVELYTNSSKYEIQLAQLLYSFGIHKEDILIGDRNVLHGKELDIYIPSKNLAIEFNGTYWHSDLFKNKKYHQNKTIEAFRNNIHIIHIFEHEWLDEDKRRIITGIIKNRLKSVENIIYAKRCHVKNIDSKTCSEFLNKNHLQGSAGAEIRLGLYYESVLLGIMTFGKPRFNTNYEYELIRLVWRTDIGVVGGAQKLFKHFIREYNPQSIISYCDISKFNGQVYFNLGFKPDDKEFITAPNYVWVNPVDNIVLTRYQTQKHKLLESGLGVPSMSEAEIMESIGFIRIYDCGNAKFVWTK